MDFVTVCQKFLIRSPFHAFSVIKDLQIYSLLCVTEHGYHEEKEKKSFQHTVERRLTKQVGSDL